MMQIPPPAEDGHADNDQISADTKGRRDLREEDKAQDSRKHDLRVIEDTDLPGRRELIGGGDRELRDRREDTRRNQTQELPWFHHLEVEDHERQRQQAGKQRETEDDDRCSFFLFSEKTHEGICNAGTCTAPYSGKCGDHRDIRGRSRDQDDTGKRHHCGHDIDLRRLFLQNRDRSQDREERRKFIEHIGIRQGKMVDRIEIAEKSGRTEKASEEDELPIPLLHLKLFFRAKKSYSRDHRSEGISEECFFHGRDITGELDEKGHECKAQRSEQNACDSLCIRALQFHLLRYPSLFIRSTFRFFSGMC